MQDLEKQLINKVQKLIQFQIQNSNVSRKIRLHALYEMKDEVNGRVSMAWSKRQEHIRQG